MVQPTFFLFARSDEEKHRRQILFLKVELELPRGLVERVNPGPKRGPGTWDEYLKIHAETLWQCDFFIKMIMTSTGLRRAYVLAFLYVNSRRVICPSATLKPDDKWVTTQAETMLE